MDRHYQKERIRPNVGKGRILPNVGEETKNEFINLFEKGLTPSAAWHTHRKEIQEKNPENYLILFGNRAICPDFFWAFYAYQKWVTEKLGSFDGVDAYQKLDGVGPVDNRPSADKLHHFVKKKKF